MARMALPFLSNLITGLEFIKRDDINQSSDPRVGSARDNSTSTKVTSLTSGTNSASFSQLFATLIPVTIYTVICLLFLFIFRRRCPRVYSPRTFLSSLHPHERSTPLPSGWFNWLVPFFKVPDTAVLNQSSLDGFLFLRYLKVLGVICAVGSCIVWPVLLPLHSYGGMGNRQLDKLTFGNIINPSWYYVHAFLAWIYFGFIMYMISRECVYYINLRQAYLIAPYYAKRLSSRTVLFTCVPQQVLDEAKLRKVFGDSVRNVWIPRYTEDLDDLVRERDQTALRLEKAEIELIKMANLERTKKARYGHPDIEEGVTFDNGRESYETKKSNDAQNQKDDEQHIISSVRRVAMPDARHSNEARQSDEPFTTSAISSMESPSSQSNSDKILELKWGNHGFGRDGPPPDVNGSVAAQWIPAESRPSHRPLANYGRRVDTIKWTRNRLKELAPRIAKLRRQHKSGKGRPIPAAFIEFDTQTDAQSAYQSLAHHRAFHMQPFIIGLRPQEIEWNTLRMFWWERIVRGFAVNGFIAVMVIFWSIPAALIGIVSNVKFLSTEVFFLHWIEKLPAPILGFISGMVPAVALAGLMALVPGLMRMCARQAGTPTSSMVELFVQQTYFIFQVVQVFLITTLTSAASAAITNIIKDPMSARDLLSQNLPKASNFYVSYFILQGLAMSATRIVHLPSLLRFYVLKTTDNPRFISNRWHRLRVIRWGSVYPVFSNIGVIAVSYSMIAPLTLGFAALTFYIVYTVYRYNLLYVYSSEIDTRGALYPHALKQTFTGVYLAEICLFGLFGLQSAFGPLVIMVGLLVFTSLVHISLNDALGPLLYNLPKTLAVQELYDQVAAAQAEAAAAAAIPDPEDPSNFHPPNEADLPEYLRSTSKDMEEGEQNTRAVEGLERGGKLTINFLSKSLQQRVRDSAASAGIPSLTTILAKIDFWTPWISPTYIPDVKPNFLLKWLHPEIFADHHILSKTIPKDLPDPEYPGETARDAYWPPSVVKEAPILWIPRDKGGVSRQEVAHCRRVGIECTDRGVSLDEKNRLVFDLGAKSPVLRERIRY